MGKKNYIYFIILCFLLLIIYFFEPFIKNYIKITFSIISIIIFITMIYLKKKNKLDFNKACNFILLFGIIFRLFYIINFPYTAVQHDLGEINENGHLDYIYTIYKTGHLPNNNTLEFYHPPLFYSIGALFLKVTSIFHFGNSRHFESLQYLTFIISIVTLIFIYKLINNVKIDDKYKWLLLLLFSCFPLSLILSGSINNDSLMIMNFIIAIYYLFKWYENSSVKNTILLALFVGLCVASKMNGVLIAVPVIYLFIVKLFNEKNKNKCISLYFIFVIISLPIGLWYPIRNYLLFHQSLFYVLSDNLEKLYVGNYSLIQRFFSFSINQYIHMFAQPYSGDYNVPTYLIKTSLFDEVVLSGNFFHVLIFFVHTVSILLFGYNVIRYCISKNKNLYINTFMVTSLFMFISFICFNIKYPFTCSMNFRYIYVIFVFLTITAIYQICFSKSRNIYKVTRNLICLFSFLSVIIFYMNFK